MTNGNNSLGRVLSLTNSSNGFFVVLLCCLVLLLTDLFGGATGQTSECLPDYCPMIPTVCDPGSPLIDACDSGNSQYLIQNALMEAETLLKNYSIQIGNTGGLFAAVSYRGQLLINTGIGISSFNKTTNDFNLANADSIWRLGSVTKIFTALLMFQLRDMGVLPSVDKDIKYYLPEFNIRNPFLFPVTTTFKQLAGHLGGIPREPPCSDYMSECNVTTSQMMQMISEANYTYLFPPYTRPAYSNFGYSILGRTLEIAGNSTYEQLVTELTLQKLGMNSSFFVLPEELSDLLASGTVTTKSSYLGWESPAGQLYASGNDMIAFLQFLLDEVGTPQHSSVLSQQSLREWLSPVFTLPDGGSAFGLPWEMMYTLFDPSNSSQGGVWWRTKSGEVDNFNSQLAVIPELDLGVIVMSNLPLAGEVAFQLTSTFASAALKVIQDVDSQIIPEYPSNLAMLQGWYNNTTPIEASIFISATSSSIEGVVYASGMVLPVQFVWQKDASNATVLAFQLELPPSLPISCLTLSIVAWDDNLCLFYLSDSGQSVQGLIMPELLPHVFFPYAPLQ